ncbi:MAG: diacylglycerol kinase family lipid kinase [Armatimonadetes bacterium]|nr:diacylglycerol kinase family lipid kinase [Armatimonadota bacterium]
MNRCLFIANTHSGGGREARTLETRLRQLSRPGVQYDLRFTERPGHAEEIARVSAADYDVLAAVGGDGTVGEVATGILSSARPETPLGILPRGTGNDVALSLGIRDWETGLAALHEDRTRPLDACEVTYMAGGGERKRLALVGAGVGFPARVTVTASKRVKRLLGKWGYTYATVVAALGYRCAEFHLEIDGRAEDRKLFLLAVSNLERTSGQTMRIAPGARYDDGLLDVILVREAGTFRLLRKLTSLADGSHIHLPEVDYFPAREILVSSPAPVGLMIDGDLVGTTPARFRVLPGALRMKAGSPPSSGGAS